MNAEDRRTVYSDRIDRLHQELETDPWDLESRRARLREEIIGLFKEIEGEIAALEGLRERVRPLVERYKELFARKEAPMPVGRVDHLGSSTYRERGWSALAGADYERAVRELEKAIEFDPDNASNLAYLAWAYLRLHDHERATPLLERVLEADRAHPLGRTCFGYLLLREGRYVEAVEQLDAVVNGTDRTAALYANLYLGVIHTERDLYRDAESFFRRALELGPNLVEAYWELGRCFQREGREDLALEAWKTGAENRFNPWGERCRVAAERLEVELGPPP